MESKELVLVCAEIGTRDYAPKEIFDKQFRDVSDWLWKKYPSQISDWLRGALGGLETPSRDRAPLLFEYTDAAGKRVTIDHTDNVSAILQVSDQVLWRPQVVGGSFRQEFGKHASEIVANPRYRNWRCVVDEQPGFGIWAVGPDPQGVVRKWTITPASDYPGSPPTVVSSPPYKNDVCWSDGVLHYTQYKHREGSPWTDLARGNANPLRALMIELLQKYKLAI